MRKTSQLVALVIALSSTASTFAQDKPDKPTPRVAEVPAPPAVAIPAVRLLPAMPRGADGGFRKKPLPFELGDLVLAKISDGAKGAQLVALVEQTRAEEREVQVTVLRQEQKTRKVLVGEGDQKKEVEQTYTVSVPVTESRNIVTQVPIGKKPTSYAMEQIKIYKLDGTIVQLEEAKKLLEKMQPVFLVQQPQAEFKPLEELYLRALNPNCLIVMLQP
jgi:hypothetical protein